ncbi:MAG: hypothetical protein FWE46_01625 [Coriobacteriia bacterium]|nr:hypothetical protein [Coriobacteriia bacterium]
MNLEVGHNEIGDADEPAWGIASDVIAIFERLGFPEPKPVPFMQLRHQIAQKIHGLSQPNSERVHDLIDLQIIIPEKFSDFQELRITCMRLFKYRNLQSWPPTIVKNEKWEDLYINQSRGLPVLASLSDAVAWANELIATIENSD